MKHVVAMPFPGRGHINPLMNLCHLLSSQLNQPNCTIVFTVVVTEEWLAFLDSDLNPANIQFVTIANVIPSELDRGSDMLGFLTAVHSKMEGPFDWLLDHMESPVDLIIADVGMCWPFDVADRRNIPIAAYCPTSASMFSFMYHSDLLELHNHLFVDLSERGNECIDYIPGLSRTTLTDAPSAFHGELGRKLHALLSNYKHTNQKAQFVLLSTIYELESEAIDALKAKLQIPIFTLGPNIRPSQLQPNPSLGESTYFKWLDSKPPNTVLYVSLGSFLSVPTAQMDEIAFGLRQSGVNFLWVTRGETTRLKEVCGHGVVVEWCDQLRVLQHSSVGGFWSHCGWNSVKEGLFSGVPMLTFPLTFDQPLNSKFIVEDWRNGWKIRKEMGMKAIVKREEIAEIVRSFMDSKSIERKKMMERVKKLQEICQQSVAEGGSACKDLDTFVNKSIN